MACTFVRVASAAGSRISAIWDGIVILNAKWSCYDAAAGANAKVYRCHDAAKSVDFYVYVDDNQADYSIIQLWEDWDEPGHAGVGDFLVDAGGNQLRLYASMGCHVIVNDHRVIVTTGWNNLQCYIGQLKRIDETKNMPVYLGRTTGATYYNPLGYYDSPTHVAWRALFNHVGDVNQALRPYAHQDTEQFLKTILGTYIFQETPVYDLGTLLILGYLDGVCYSYTTPNGFGNGQIISCEDGDWLVQGGEYSTKYWAAVRLI